MSMSKKDKDKEEAIGKPLSGLRPTTVPEAIEIEEMIVGDVHISDKPPIARSAESDWFAAMQRPFDQIRTIHQSLPKAVPIFYVGDIVHKWNLKVETVNWAIQYIPYGHAITGQHDLPHHRFEDVHKSAFWTLTRAHAIDPLPNGLPIQFGRNTMVVGCGWKTKIPYAAKGKNVKLIALVHRYIWSEGFGYKKAPASHHINKLKPRLKGYDVAFFGDNHTPFYVPNTTPKIINCGSLMARNSDQRNYEPCVYFVHKNGGVSWQKLDTSQDKWLTKEEVKKKIRSNVSLRGLKSLAKKFEDLADEGMDLDQMFEQALRSEKVCKGVKRAIRDLLESFYEK